MRWCNETCWKSTVSNLNYIPYRTACQCDITNGHSHNGDQNRIYLILHIITYQITITLWFQCEVAVTNFWVICTASQNGTYRLQSDSFPISCHVLAIWTVKITFRSLCFPIFGHIQVRVLVKTKHDASSSTLIECK